MDELKVSMAGRRLGASGLSVFPLSYGMWRFAGTDVETASAKIRAALKAGIDLFDTADIYGFDGTAGFGAAEELFGAVLAADPRLRPRMLIATKGGIEPGVPYNSTVEYLERACEASLRRMRIDTIDLYQIHRPDLLGHPQEVARGLTRLTRSGKVRFVGVSNFTVPQVRALQRYYKDPLVATQPEFSALHYQPLFDGTMDHAMEMGMAVLAWSPLAGGRLAQVPDDERGKAVAAKLDEIAARHNVSRPATALAWTLAHPANVIPILGTQQPERISESLDAFKVRFTRQEWYAVLQASMGESLP